MILESRPTTIIPSIFFRLDWIFKQLRSWQLPIWHQNLQIHADKKQGQQSHQGKSWRGLCVELYFLIH